MYMNVVLRKRDFSSEMLQENSWYSQGVAGLGD